MTGTVVLPFGRHFAGKVDFLTRDGYRALPPIDGLSPFSAIGPREPEAVARARSARTNDRAAMDADKSFAAMLADCGADVLVVDNSPALLRLRRLGDALYTVVPGEKTDLMDFLWSDDEEAARAQSVRAAGTGLTPELRTAYLAFADAVRERFAPNRIVLIRSHVPRFHVTDEGQIGLTNGAADEARLLAELDALFLSRVECLVSDAALAVFPSQTAWQSFGTAARRPIEDDIVRLLDHGTPRLPVRDAAPSDAGDIGPSTADLIADAVRKGREPSSKEIASRVRAHPVSHGDAVGLAYLAQSGTSGRWLARCVRRAVRDARSLPVRRSHEAWTDAAQALGEVFGHATGPAPRAQRPHIAFRCRPHLTLALSADGRAGFVHSTEPSRADADMQALQDTPLALAGLEGWLRSWPFHLARGRAGVTSPVTAYARDARALADSCGWIPWRTLLRENTLNLRIGTAQHAPTALPDAGPSTDLSFLFDPRTRVFTVGGGLMDQVTHIALYEQACERAGVAAVYDDLRYVWWRAHNGFEADRLTTLIGDRRVTRRVSPTLIERFRDEVDGRRPYLPWVYSQSRAWRTLGLDDACFVARDDDNSRRLRDADSDLPMRIYLGLDELFALVHTPPAPVTVFTTQDRAPIEYASAQPLRSVFGFDALTSRETPPAAVSALAARMQDRAWIALHVRRGDFLSPHFDVDGWFGEATHYRSAIESLRARFAPEPLNIAVFSDDLAHVRAHASEYGLDQREGEVVFVEGNRYFDAIWDAYLMALCPVIIGSVGNFAATASLLADPPNTFVLASPDATDILWHNETLPR